MSALAAYALSQGPVFWLAVAAGFLAFEAATGRAWWIWAAYGAGVSALLTLWLDLSLLVELLAFVAATVFGLAWSLQMRFAAAREKALRQQR